MSLVLKVSKYYYWPCTSESSYSPSSENFQFFHFNKKLLRIIRIWDKNGLDWLLKIALTYSYSTVSYIRKYWNIYSRKWDKKFFFNFLTFIIAFFFRFQWFLIQCTFFYWELLGYIYSVEFFFRWWFHTMW